MAIVNLELVVGEAHGDEDDSQDCEATDLNWLATNSIDCGHCHPVAGNGSSKDNNRVSNGSVKEHLVDCWASGVPNGLQDDRIVKRQSIVGADYVSNPFLKSGNKLTHPKGTTNQLCQKAPSRFGGSSSRRKSLSMRP